MEVKRFDVFLINLDPTIGAEIKKSWPCVIISPDEVNLYLSTVIVAPMTTIVRGYPTRVSCKFRGKEGQIAIDQIRTVDKTRLVKNLGKIDVASQKRVLQTLLEMFAP